MIVAGTHNGTITQGKVDYFRINASAGTTITVEVRLGTLPDVSVAILNAGSGTMTENPAADPRDRVARVTYVVRAPGAYYIRLRSTPAATGTYTLTLTIS